MLKEAAQAAECQVPRIALIRNEAVQHGYGDGFFTGHAIFESTGQRRGRYRGLVRSEELAHFHFRMYAPFQAAEHLHHEAVAERD